MKVCIVRHAYFPDDPRDRKQAFAILEAGHSVDVICLRKAGQNIMENVQGTNVFRIPLAHKRLGFGRYFAEYSLAFMMMTLVLLCRFVRKRYDLIQVSTMPDFLVFSTIIPKRCGAKVLLDLHEPIPELWITKYGNKFSFVRSLQEKIEQSAIRYADWSITVTEALRRRFGQRGADIRHITVIPNVCDETFDEALSIISATKSTEKDERFRLVTHGLIEERYGHDLVIMAMKGLMRYKPEIHYYIIGDGEYKDELVKLAKENGCEERVHFLGFLAFEELLQQILRADVGIVPMKRSPYSELVDTNKMYEYMALRKPIIISRLSAVNDNFDDDCMTFFEPDNQDDLAKCIRDLQLYSDKRLKIVNEAYKRYSKIRWKETKREYLKVLEDLLQNNA